jgi:hypothetical protein
MNLSNRLFYAMEICRRQSPSEIDQSRLADRGQLIRGRLVLLSSKHDGSLTGIQAIHRTREGHNLQAVEVFVGRIVADDHGRALLLDFAADRWAEGDSPNLTSFHWRHLQ